MKEKKFDLVSLCYSMLRTHYSPWVISFNVSNSSQDFNFGVKFVICVSAEGDENYEYSDWGYTLNEALEKVAFRIAVKETDRSVAMDKIEEDYKHLPPELKNKG